MKANIIRYALVASTVLTLTSCNNWLKEESPGTNTLDDYFTSGQTAIQVVNAAYTPLAWEYNRTYYSEWYIGDIASDDALKGGQDLADGQDAYDIDNFKVNINNAILLDYYRAKYQGIGRCNLALQEVPKVALDDVLTEDRRNCLLGEAHFMRAFYYFQLVRVFGGVPLVDFVISDSENWQQPRATAEKVYDFIIDELLTAEKLLWDKSKFPAEDLGRATRGAAQAMLCKVYLYKKDYANAYTWGKKFVEEQYGKEYALHALYADNFLIANENGIESVFEIQRMAEPTSDYGEGNGFTRGSFTTILTRPRMSCLGGDKGWGFDHPTKDLWNEFEPGDSRREAAIGVPDEESQKEVEVMYLNSPYYNNKICYSENGAFPPLDHASRSPFNYPLIRVSDVLLLYAEAALESGHQPDAKWALEQVRSRARKNADPSVTNPLPEFPGYLGYTNDDASLRKAIRHERRVELAMEGHRWYDLVRWGIAADVMNAYRDKEDDVVRAEMSAFQAGKHELFPIPAEELALNPMEQNPGY
ncbi:MAG: RagB/SusD family nutrient uptake outer membrane protein [Muribaculaceae bacterium]|nr:RagB/SusD family nutrient uptake outer membrane protein [Muribaculaceae bacterium]